MRGAMRGRAAWAAAGVTAGERGEIGRGAGAVVAECVDLSVFLSSPEPRRTDAAVARR